MFVAIFIVSIVAAIMLHEAGHFFSAKAFGMKAERFFLGFGPTLWSVRRGETEYGVKAIPAGGFVKITGMNKFEGVEPADRPRAFFSKPAWQRVIVLVAGSVTHFLIAALLLFFALWLFAVPRLVDGAPVPVNVVDEVSPDSPARAAGIQSGDEIVRIDGVAIDDFSDLATAVEQRGGETVALTLLRDGERLELPVSLASHAPDGTEQGFLGVSPEPVISTVRYSFGEALAGVFVGDYSVPTVTWRSVEGLAQAFSPDSLSAWLAQADSDAERGTEGPISLVGAGQAVAALGQMGEISAIILLLAQLNIVIGTLNMLPLPPLDGGHVAVLAVEQAVNRVRARRGLSTDWQADPAAVTPIAVAVLMFFVAISVTAIYIDIVNPVSELLR